MKLFENFRARAKERREQNELEKKVDYSGHLRLGSIVKLHDKKGFWRVEKIERLDTGSIPGYVLMQFRYYFSNIQTEEKIDEVM